MKRRSRKQHLIAEINITPFTDVILVLLVIFMIATPLLYQSQAQQIKVNLPKAKHVVAPKASGDVVVITLSSEGPIYLEGGIVTAKELEDQLALKKEHNPSLPVLLEIDRLVAFKNVVRILDILNGLDIQNLRIAAEQQEK